MIAVSLTDYSHFHLFILISFYSTGTSGNWGSGGGGGNDGWGAGSNRGGGVKKRGASSTSNEPGAKRARKCGLCGVEGELLIVMIMNFSVRTVSSALIKVFKF